MLMDSALREQIRARKAALEVEFGISVDLPHLDKDGWEWKTVPWEKERVASYIDHTILKTEATREQVDKVCEEAIERRFASVCVNGFWAKHCLEKLQPKGIPLACVIGFPLGAMTTHAKAYETEELVKMGVSEIDMVFNVGALLSGDVKTCFEDVKAVVQACHPREHKALLKVIIESALLDKPERIIDACLISAAAGADYVKTSTGFHAAGGAKAEHVRIMRSVVGDKLGVKASGGVRSLDDAITMLEAGACRIGASSGVAIDEGQKARAAAEKKDE